MKKLMCGFVGLLIVTWFMIAMVKIGAHYSDDVILLSMVIAASAGVLSVK